jgi:NADH:ubiquinone oxidoreductase subunit 5 (subunit L)/multisubunit Na+/H+ antiporter MnhA subunit
LQDVSNVHESPPIMLWPLRFLAALSIIGGFIGLGVAYNHFFSGKTESGATMTAQLLDVFENPVALLAGLVAIVLGYLAASALYQRAAIDPLPARLGALARWMRNRFYLDEIYEATFIRFHEFLSRIADAIDRVLIDGVGVGLVRGGTELAGKTLRQFQTGNLQAYAVLFALGVAIVLYLALK